MWSQKLDTAEGQLEQRFLRKVEISDVGGVGLESPLFCEERVFVTELHYLRMKDFEMID